MAQNGNHQAVDGVTSHADLEARMQEGGVAGVIVQQPNRYGIIEDFHGLLQTPVIIRKHYSSLIVLLPTSPY